MNSEDTIGAPVPAAGAPARRSLITFRIANQLFALPVERVTEVIRPPRLVPVPLSPPSLAGLANLRGRVLAVADGPRLLRLAGEAAGGSARVLVVQGEVAFGLAVERMGRMVVVEEGLIEAVGEGDARVDAALLRGVVRDLPGLGAALLLDPERLLAADFADVAREPAPRAPAVAATAAAAGDERMTLIAFSAAGQEYALPVEQVVAIVRPPDTVIRIPHAGGYVAGVASVRDRLLPLVSLHELFGLPGAAGTARRVVVASLGRHGSVGLLVEEARSVLRVERRCVDPLPPLLANGDGGDEIAAIARLDGGRRLVSILSPEWLRRQGAVQRAMAALADRESDAMPETATGGDAGDFEQFIVFRLGTEEYGLPVAAVAEVMRLPPTLTRVPKAPAFVAGIANRRGAPLPVIDLRRRFELPSRPGGARGRILVFSVDGVAAGLTVDAVARVLKVPRDAIGPAPLLSPEQARLVGRVARLDDQGRMLLLIDPAELLDRKERRALARMGG